MIKRIAFAALLALSSTLAHAAPPSDAQIDKLLDVMRARQTVDAMLPKIEAMQQQMLAQMTAGKSFTDQQNKDMQRILAASSRNVREALAWEKLEPVYRDIYRQTFSGEDMDAMIAFYGSRAGQSVLDKMPQLMQNTMGAMQKIVGPMVEQMQRDLATEVDDTSLPADGPGK